MLEFSCFSSSNLYNSNLASGDSCGMTTTYYDPATNSWKCPWNVNTYFDGFISTDGLSVMVDPSSSSVPQYGSSEIYTC